MKIYNYSGVNGEYLNEGVADESPLEDGVWLIPAFATKKAPPEAGQNEVAAWNGTGWSLKPDYRGQTFYDSEGKKIVISEIGIQPEPTWSTTEPAPVPPTIEELRAKMEVTAFQAKAALGRQSLYENVVALMDAPETPFEVKLAWQEALTFKRLSPTVLSMGAALGFTDEQLDGLFELAATIGA